MASHQRPTPPRRVLVALVATSALLLPLLGSATGASPAAAAADPTAVVTTPADGAVYGPSQVVLADYSCDYLGVAFTTGCTGTVADGSPLDTSTAGDHAFTATATDAHGTGTVTVHYVVTEKPPSYRSTVEALQGRDDVLSSPDAVDVGADGTLYIADTLADRIVVVPADGSDAAVWGGPGTGPGQFDHPAGIVVALDGRVFVSDTGNDRVQILGPTGAFLTQLGGSGQFDRPLGIDLDEGSGDLYVVDAGHNRVHRFTAAGYELGYLGSFGTGEGQFNTPRDVAVASQYAIYVTDGYNNRVQVFDSMGGYRGGWGEIGSRRGEFINPWGVDVAPDGSVYVTDNGNDRVQHFLADGRYLSRWGTTGHRHGQLFGATGLAVSPVDASVAVADRSNGRIEVFARQPRPDAWARKGAGTDHGDGVYGTDGAGQTASSRVAPGVAATYTVTLENDAPIPDALVVRGPAATARFAVRYRVGGVGVGGAVRSGTYTTPTLAPGATVALEVQIVPRSAAPRGAVFDAKVTVRSAGDPARRDAVRLVTTRA